MDVGAAKSWYVAAPARVEVRGNTWLFRRRDAANSSCGWNKTARDAAASTPELPLHASSGRDRNIPEQDAIGHECAHGRKRPPIRTSGPCSPAASVLIHADASGCQRVTSRENLPGIRPRRTGHPGHETESLPA